jgi:hypothetical protein
MRQAVADQWAAKALKAKHRSRRKTECERTAFIKRTAQLRRQLTIERREQS